MLVAKETVVDNLGFIAPEFGLPVSITTLVSEILDRVICGGSKFSVTPEMHQNCNLLNKTVLSLYTLVYKPLDTP